MRKSQGYGQAFLHFHYDTSAMTSADARVGGIGGLLPEARRSRLADRNLFFLTSRGT